jgi:uncharacterized membrane protein YhaH (DUF805 family)
MRQLLDRFTFESVNFNWQVGLCLFLIWAVLAGCAVLSIQSQSFSDRQRRAWLWVVACVPVVGVLAYLPFSIRKQDLPQIFLIIMQKRRHAREMKKSALPKGHNLS